MSDAPKLHSVEWFQQKVDQAKAEIASWPKWMQETARFVGPPTPVPVLRGWSEDDWRDFCWDAYHRHGRFLSGKFAHWCYEYDGMAIDETCPEFENCLCFAGVSDE